MKRLSFRNLVFALSLLSIILLAGLSGCVVYDSGYYGGGYYGPYGYYRPYYYYGYGYNYPHRYD